MKPNSYGITFTLLFFLSFGLLSCWGFFSKPQTYTYVEAKRWAWKPVYTLDTSYRIISFSGAKPVQTAGKIYVKDYFIYQCDVGSGIHVIDNSTPSSAKRVGFINVPGCEEISIKGNVLYTNNYYDLISIDITSYNNPHIISRTRNAFFGSNGLPHSWEHPKDTGFYQCPAYSMDSVIVSWVKDSVFANCYNP